jgi:hypothetical protein
MHTNYRKDAERSIGQDLSGPGGSANFIDIDIGMDMMTKVERRSSYRQPGKINSWYIHCNSLLYCCLPNSSFAQLFSSFSCRASSNLAMFSAFRCSFRGSGEEFRGTVWSLMEQAHTKFSFFMIASAELF